MPVMKCGQAVIASVLDHGVDTVFGIPGGQTYELFDALYDEAQRVRLVTSRHEQGAAYMAFGYAQATGRVGVYTVVPGPGVLNTMAALSTAYARNAPVLCLAGQVPLPAVGRGIGYLHDVPDQSGMLERITKWTGFIGKPEEAGEKVAAAFQHLRTGRSRPVALEIPPDVLAQRAEITLPTPATTYLPAAPDPDRIKQAAQLLAGARRPMIYIGGGAVDAGEELLALAQLLQAPVVSQRGGRGVVSDRHYLSQTFPAGHRLWPQVDVVVAVGTRLKYPRLHWGMDAGLSIVHIDIDAEELNRLSEPAVPVLGDAKLAVGALVAELEKIIRPRSSREEDLSALKRSMRAQFETVQPQLAYLDVIRRELPDDGIFVDEITQVGYTSWYGFPVYSPRTFVSSGYAGNLGYGYATAVGVQVGRPDRKVVAISGDGGFLFNSQELATAVKHRLNVVSIVFRDGAFGNVARAQTLRYSGRIIGTDLCNPDFVKLAEAYGAIGYRAESPDALAKTLQRAFTANGPVVIDVPLRETADPWQFLLLPKARSPGKTKAA
jgi:acetolactate synthase-1/2/3 large subunit